MVKLTSEYWVVQDIDPYKLKNFQIDFDLSLSSIPNILFIKVSY